MPEPLRWGDSIRDADRVVSRAIEEAREQGYRQGHAAGFRAGVEEGHREGLYNALTLLRRAAWSRPFRWAHLKPNDAVEAACKWFLSGMPAPTKPNPITAAQLPAEDRA